MSVAVVQGVILLLAAVAALAHDRSRTKARWTRWATGVKAGMDVKPARKWHHRPLAQRAVIQALTVILAAETTIGLLRCRGLTVTLLILAAALAATWTAAWAYQRTRQHAAVIGHVTLKAAIRHAPAAAAQWWNHRRGYTVRLRDSTAAIFGVIPWQTKVAPDLSRVEMVPPYTFAGHEHERLAVVSTVGTLLHAEGLEPDWSKLHGRKPRIVFDRTEPPPPVLHWDGRIAQAVAAAKPHELVIGIGHKKQVIKASLESDSPHLGIGMGTGAGKSNLAAFWLVQRLILGDVAIILDGKRTSHPWAFKDMDANYDLLPNVAYARRIDDIHNLLVFLGKLLAERNEAAEKMIDARGRLHGSIAPRLFILAEELNMIVEMLKTYWGILRAADPSLPKKSPALMALGAISYAGRSVLMNIIFLGQRLDAAVFGCTPSEGGAVRGQVGVRAVARYDKNAWDLQTGGSPWVPSPSVVGRVQAWIGGNVSECQVPHMEHKDDRSILRELAVSGDVTRCPPGMPGSRSVSVLDKPAIQPAPDRGIVQLGQGREPHPANLVTLAEAHAAGVFNGRSKEAVQRASTRRGFAAPVRREGRSYLYDIDDLLRMQQDKELAR